MSSTNQRSKGNQLDRRFLTAVLRDFYFELFKIEFAFLNHITKSVLLLNPSIY